MTVIEGKLFKYVVFESMVPSSLKSDFYCEIGPHFLFRFQSKILTLQEKKIHVVELTHSSNYIEGRGSLKC